MTIPRSEGFLEVADGERIWFETAGVGPDLVLCHGLGGNGAVWFQQIPYFARNYRVITWDQRGFGRSSNLKRKQGPLSAVSDLLALLDHLAVPRAHLIGQSMGGWAALGAALAAPERIASLVLACTTAGIPVDRDSVTRPAPPPQGHALPLGVHPAIGNRLPQLDLARAYLYQALGTFGDRPSDAEFMGILAGTSFDADALRSLGTPTLMIGGELDPLMTPALLRDASAYLSHSTVVEMTGRGHSPYFEDPDAWNAVVGEFLGQHAI